MQDPTYRRASDAQHVDLGDELVALDGRTGSCFGFNPVAATVWHNLDTPKTFDDLRQILLDEYDVTPEQCSHELQSLLDDLVEQGLVAADG